MNSSFASTDDKGVFLPTLYKQRWVILFSLTWLNFTNGILWISYSSISDIVSVFYNISLDQVNYLSLVFPVITIILGLPVICGMDKVGLRVTCIVCGWLNLISALLRFVSSDVYVPSMYRYWLVMLGQVIGAVAQPLALFSPAKLASLWFPSDQRALATTFSAMGNPLGILVGSVLPPICIKYGLFQISIAILVIALISALLPTLGIYNSSPPSPPTISSDRTLPANCFLSQLKICATSPSFILLSIGFGIGLGLFTALSTLFEQIFCPYGYSDVFAGICGGILIGAGILGSFVSGLVADKTKAFSEIVQFCLVCTTFGLIAFSIVTKFTNFEIPIGITVAWIGTFGVALYSVSLELGAEITFPVSENVSTGLLVVSGQIFSVVFILLTQCLYETFTINVPMQCSSKVNDVRKDFWRFNVFISCVAVAATSVLLLCFKAQYRRRMTENGAMSTQDTFDRDLNASMTP